MRYEDKIKGFSSFEIIIYIALTIIFASTLFPILSINQQVDRMFISQSMVEKNIGEAVEIIERSIRKSGDINISYRGKEYVTHSFAIVEYNQQIFNKVDEDFFKYSSARGNTLFLQIPESNGKKVVLRFLIFQFLKDSLYIYEGKKLLSYVSIENSQEFIRRVSGEFEKTKYGIGISLSAGDRKNMHRWEFKGYENFYTKP